MRRWFVGRTGTYHLMDKRPTEVGEHYIARCGVMPKGRVTVVLEKQILLPSCRCQNCDRLDRTHR